MSENPIQQEIDWLHIYETQQSFAFYRVGYGRVTRIEATVKSGMHADIPYIRVWKGDQCHSEHCQHNVLGVGFKPSDKCTGDENGE